MANREGDEREQRGSADNDNDNESRQFVDLLSNFNDTLGPLLSKIPTGYLEDHEFEDILLHIQRLIDLDTGNGHIRKTFSSLLRRAVLPNVDRRLSSFIEEVLGRDEKDVLLGDARPGSSSLHRRSHPALLFFNIDESQKTLEEFDLYDCAVRDRSLKSLPDQIWQREAILPAPIDNCKLDDRGQTANRIFVFGINNKVVLWSGFRPTGVFTFILNADQEQFWIFCPLNNRGPVEALANERQRTYQRIVGATAVESHLVVTLAVEGPGNASAKGGALPGEVAHVALDTNKESWSLLPEFPVPWHHDLSFGWNGKLYVWLYRRGVVVYFDFQKRVWVQTDGRDGDHLARVARRLSDLPTDPSGVPRGLKLVAPRWGTLFAIRTRDDDEVNESSDRDNISVLAMSDLGVGWKEVDVHKTISVPLRAAKGFDPLCWAVGSSSVLVLAQQPPTADKSVYDWWLINESEGIHASNSLNLPKDVSFDHWRIAKIES